MGEIFTEGGRCFLILEAIRSAARDFYRNAPKTEEEQWQQELRFQGDQETIWYDPDFIEPLRQLAFSRKWVERFRELGHGGKPSDVLRELRAEIDENGLMCAVLNALNCWDGELAKKRDESGLPEYRLEYVKEQMEKMELARKGLCELDEEGGDYRDYIGHLQAVQWLNGVTGEAATIDQAGEPAATRQQGDKAAGPGGFIGFCVGKIEALPPDIRAQFLATNKGDSSFYDYGPAWHKEWQELGNNALKGWRSSVSKAKRRCREFASELKN